MSKQDMAFITFYVPENSNFTVDHMLLQDQLADVKGKDDREQPED